MARRVPTVVWLTLCCAPALISAQPDDLFKAGVTALQAQRFTEAEAVFRELYLQEPDNSRGIIGVAQAMIAQNNLNEAEKLLKAESEAHPERIDLHIAFGSAAAGMKEPEVALAEFRRTLDLMDIAAKDRAGVYLKISDVYRGTGDLRGALEALRSAAELAPQNALVITNLAMAIEQSGDKQNAVRQYRAAIAIKQDNPIALNNLAFLMTETGGDLFEALRFARLAKQSAPQNPEIADTVGWVTLKLGWVDDAFGTFSDLVRKQPGNKTYRSHLSLANDQRLPRSEAANQLRKALAEEPTPENQKLVVDLLSKR